MNKRKFNNRKCNSNQKWNNNKCGSEQKNPKNYACERDYIWNCATFTCENSKYFGIIIDYWIILYDEIIKVIKTLPAKGTSTNFFVLLAFSLITRILLIAVSIYCYLIKYWANQKPDNNTNNKLKEIDVGNII